MDENDILLDLYHPSFPAEWERHSLHDLADWINGLAFRNDHFTPTGKPVVKIAEIKNGLSGQTKYTQADYDEKYRLILGDMLFSWSGQPETSIDAFWWRGPEGWLNQHIFKVLPKDICDRTFFYYLLKHLKPHFIRIAHNKQTTGLGHVTKADLQRMEVAVPKTKKEQRAVAHILGTLDDKIELSRRMNETLEGIARTIFKSWFVDFDPVRAEADGRDTGLPKEIEELFPDGLEDTVLGKIPKGWNTQPLYEVAAFVNGKAFKPHEFSIGTEGIPVVKIAELKNGITAQTKYTLNQYPDKYHIDNGAMLFSWSGSPDTSLDTFIWSRGPGWLNQHIFSVVPKREEERTFVFYLLRHLRSTLVEIARDKQTTGLGHVTARDMKLLRVVRPPESVVDQFHSLVFPLYQQSLAINIQGLQVSAVRDNLLPALLSGKVAAPLTQWGPHEQPPPPW